MRSLLGVALLACACGTVASSPDAPPQTPDAMPDAPPVDECAQGLHDCDVNADCIDDPDGFRCACRAGWTGDGTSCADVDECAAATARCDATARCTNTEGDHTCACPGGATDVNGDGSLCPPSGDGHVVLIGHDYFERNAGADTLLGNAVLLANTTGTVRVAAYSQYADTTVDTEVPETDLADLAIQERATARGRTVTITRFADSALFPDVLYGTDVLLIYEQENIDGGVLTGLADAWTAELQAFVGRGGIVVVTSTNSEYLFVQRSGLLDASLAAATFGIAMSPVTAAAADPVLADVGPYTGPNASAGFTTSEPGVLVKSDNNYPVVIHRVVAGGHAVLMGHDFYQRSAEIDTLIANAVLLARTSGPIEVLGWSQYADQSAAGEVVLTNAAIGERLAAAGRAVNITTFTDYTFLASYLPGKHVLVIYEQETTDGPTLATVGTAWNAHLQRFVRNGGVVIALDDGNLGTGTAWNVLNSGGLMAVASSTDVTLGGTVTVAVPSDPLAAGLPATYAATNGSAGYSVIGGETVVAAFGDIAVVVHKIFTPF